MSAVKFDLAVQLKQFADKAKSIPNAIRKELESNADIASLAMVESAKAHTPHEGDGKKRGFFVISNSLQDSWHVEYKKVRSKAVVGNISLQNDKHYASYVQSGHRVSKHFVPWLYKDGMGTLSYEPNHNQPLFGLVVGTKTPYVKGVDMVGPAVDAFNEKFDELTKETLSKLEL